MFQPKIFGELQNAQAVVLPYDGLNPKPPTYCYLKPHDLDVQTSYFDHVSRGGSVTLGRRGCIGPGLIESERKTSNFPE